MFAVLPVYLTFHETVLAYCVVFIDFIWPICVVNADVGPDFQLER